jgi:peptidoglycan/LPS O-acetylase OafA/YrhL
VVRSGELSVVDERRDLRGDVEGLRAVAVLAVVLHHAGVPGFSGGYVGVDVFFVLSGFLITGLLHRELQRSGRIALGSFYARRARRLLPAAVLVLLVTVLASAVLLPPLQARQVALDGVAAAVYAANYRFAMVSTDYLSPETAPSPLQHYWSLGVEEQFYLAWPLLLVLAVWAVRRSRRLGRVLVVTGLAGLVVASFAASVVLTSLSQPWAFFSLPSRAWELGAGAMVALASPRLGHLGPRAAIALGWIGLVTVVFSVTQLSTDTTFPGFAALLPVAGTVAVVAAGCAGPATGPVRLLGIRPLQVIGGLSYSWYLWHWPVLLLAPAALTDSLAGRLGLAALSGVVAAGTVRAVENPIRFPSGRLSRPGPALAGAGVLTAVAVAAAGTTAAAVPSPEGGTRVAPTRALPVPVTSHRGPETDTPPPASPVPVDPVTAATAPVMEELARSLTARDVPANLRPALARAHRDKAEPFVDGCHVHYTGTRSGRCTYGDPHGATSVVLFGDSHATQWFPALEVIAAARGWRLEVLVKTTCPPFELSLVSPVLKRRYRECEAWRADALERIRTERPAVVVLGAARHYEARYYQFEMFGPEWLAGIDRTVQQIRAAGAAAVVLGPTPKPPSDVPTCLSEHLTAMDECVTPVATAVSASGAAAERAAARAAGAHYVDVPRLACTTTSCPPTVGDLLIYRDDNHLTTTYTTWLAPVLAAEIDAALSTGPRAGASTGQGEGRPVDERVGQGEDHAAQHQQNDHVDRSAAVHQEGHLRRR